MPQPRFKVASHQQNTGPYRTGIRKENGGNTGCPVLPCMRLGAYDPGMDRYERSVWWEENSEKIRLKIGLPMIFAGLIVGFAADYYLGTAVLIAGVFVAFGREMV